MPMPAAPLDVRCCTFLLAMCQRNELWKPDCMGYKPLNVYGQTKLEGELAANGTLQKYFIVRIAWIFGLNGKTLLRL